jgi:hypothetical protein
MDQEEYACHIFGDISDTWEHSLTMDRHLMYREVSPIRMLDCYT